MYDGADARTHDAWSFQCCTVLLDCLPVLLRLSDELQLDTKQQHLSMCLAD